MSVRWLCAWVQWRCCQADWRCWLGVVDTFSEWSPQVIVLGGSWCCCVELLPTQRLMLCSFEGATEGHYSGAGDILLLVIGAERKIKVVEVGHFSAWPSPSVRLERRGLLYPVRTGYS